MFSCQHPYICDLYRIERYINGYSKNRFNWINWSDYCILCDCFYWCDAITNSNLLSLQILIYPYLYRAISKELLYYFVKSYSIGLGNNKSLFQDNILNGNPWSLIIPFSFLCIRKSTVTIPDCKRSVNNCTYSLMRKL